MNQAQIAKSQSLLGETTVDMLFRVHQDALWMLENLGVGCKQPTIVEAFRRHELLGEAYLYDNRIYLTRDLVEKCLATTPGIDDFFVPRNSFFVGGTAPYLYDDAKGEGGVMPRPEDVARIARIADQSSIVAGMGRGVKLKFEEEQIGILDQNCRKPLYFAVTTPEALAKAKDVWNRRPNVMIVFCLTRPPLEVNENFSDMFVQVVQAGLPVFISAMPLAGISAPFCYNGVLAATHAEVLFGICVAQLLKPGAVCVHGGFPTIADPRVEYNPNYGLISHQILNLLMAHLNMMLDLPSIQSAGTTNEEHPTEKAFQDARRGQALCKKYGFHMIRHPFAFLRLLVDFSIAKMEKCIEIAQNVSADEAPDVQMPVYDERAMESVQKIGLGFYLNDPLTTANFGKIFVD
jgi:trimethylamine:corrinoid methyltransferase-like protein